MQHLAPTEFPAARYSRLATAVLVKQLALGRRARRWSAKGHWRACRLKLLACRAFCQAGSRKRGMARWRRARIKLSAVRAFSSRGVQRHENWVSRQSRSCSSSPHHPSKTSPRRRSLPFLPTGLMLPDSGAGLHRPRLIAEGMATTVEDVISVFSAFTTLPPIVLSAPAPYKRPPSSRLRAPLPPRSRLRRAVSHGDVTEALGQWTMN